MLCGFSKGGVVLSALLRVPSQRAFWQGVREVHFLDVGAYRPREDGVLVASQAGTFVQTRGAAAPGARNPLRAIREFRAAIRRHGSACSVPTTSRTGGLSLDSVNRTLLDSI